MWNWQDAEWPNFRWDAGGLVAAEAAFLQGAGVTIGVDRHLDEAERQGLSIDLLSHEAVDTSAIEGEHLDRASGQASIQRQLGLAADRHRITFPVR